MNYHYPDNKSVANEEETWLIEDHLAELFAEVFQSNILLEQRVNALEAKVEQLQEKLNSLKGG